MFTGLVQQVGTVRSVIRKNEGWSLVISCEPWKLDLEPGESMAVQGACLTVTSASWDSFTADLLDETMDKTMLSDLDSGSLVNLERALAVGDRLGGHIVSGHVDEIGSVLAVTKRGRDYVVRIGCSSHLADCSILKGSITIDGVSLTISALGDNWLEVNVIPHTWEMTTLSGCSAGDKINLEGDVLGKYIVRFLNRDRQSGITEEMLRENGFV
ncbi:MAG: riboflavin synthase [Kiritimatiellia bacterium]